MCGRYAITLSPDAMRRLFDYAEQPNFPPRYNVAPTQPVPIVRAERGQRHFGLVRWGFLPGFVKDPRAFPLIINARAEGIETKPSFRAAIRRRRCLFIADGWYEWRRAHDARGRIVKQPFLFRAADRGPLAFAGLWETWSDPQGGEVDTGCIITTAANGATVAVHAVMPAIIAPTDFDRWLDCSDDRATRAEMLKPAPDGQIEFFEVSPKVNSYRNEGPELQAPVAPGLF